LFSRKWQQTAVKYEIETATKGGIRPIKNQTMPKSIAATVTPTVQNRKKRKNLSCVITTN
jgi:hypothetical protein